MSEQLKCELATLPHLLTRDQQVAWLCDLSNIGKTQVCLPTLKGGCGGPGLLGHLFGPHLKTETLRPREGRTAAHCGQWAPPRLEPHLDGARGRARLSPTTPAAISAHSLRVAPTPGLSLSPPRSHLRPSLRSAPTQLRARLRSCPGSAPPPAPRPAPATAAAAAAILGSRHLNNNFIDKRSHGAGLEAEPAAWGRGSMKRGGLRQGRGQRETPGRSRPAGGGANVRTSSLGAGGRGGRALRRTRSASEAPKAERLGLGSCFSTGGARTLRVAAGAEQAAAGPEGTAAGRRRTGPEPVGCGRRRWARRGERGPEMPSKKKKYNARFPPVSTWLGRASAGRAPGRLGPRSCWGWGCGCP